MTKGSSTVSEIARVAEANGARSCGVAPAAALTACVEEIERILPRAGSMIVLDTPH